MIKIIEGNLLTVKEGIIAHQVNAQGVMGSGLALQLKTKYPILYYKYSKFCEAIPNKQKLLGECQIVDTGQGVRIANLFGQLNFGRDKSVVYTDYNALRNALNRLKISVEWTGLPLALPYNLGCGLANGDWNVVYNMIDEILNSCDVAIYKLKE